MNTWPFLGSTLQLSAVYKCEKVRQTMPFCLSYMNILSNSIITERDALASVVISLEAGMQRFEAYIFAVSFHLLLFAFGLSGV